MITLKKEIKKRLQQMVTMKLMPTKEIGKLAQYVNDDLSDYATAEKLLNILKVMMEEANI